MLGRASNNGAQPASLGTALCGAATLRTPLFLSSFPAVVVLLHRSFFLSPSEHSNIRTFTPPTRAIAPYPPRPRTPQPSPYNDGGHTPPNSASHGLFGRPRRRSRQSPTTPGPFVNTHMATANETLLARLPQLSVSIIPRPQHPVRHAHSTLPASLAPISHIHSSRGSSPRNPPKTTAQPGRAISGLILPRPHRHPFAATPPRCPRQDTHGEQSRGEDCSAGQPRRG